jgi:hypothetical protein
VASEGEHLPTEVSYDGKLSPVMGLVKLTSTQMSFPQTVFDSCANILWLCKPTVVRGGWSQMIMPVEKLDVEVLGWRGYTWFAIVSPVGRTAKFYKRTL